MHWKTMNEEYCPTVEFELCPIYQSYDLLCFTFNFVIAPFIVMILDRIQGGAVLFLLTKLNMPQRFFSRLSEIKLVLCGAVLFLLWLAGPTFFFASQRDGLQGRLDCFKGNSKLQEWLQFGCPRPKYSHACSKERYKYFRSETLALPTTIDWILFQWESNTTLCFLVVLSRQFGLVKRLGLGQEK